MCLKIYKITYVIKLYLSKWKDNGLLLAEIWKMLNWDSRDTTSTTTSSLTILLARYKLAIWNIIKGNNKKSNTYRTTGRKSSKQKYRCSACNFFILGQKFSGHRFVCFTQDGQVTQLAYLWYSSPVREGMEISCNCLKIVSLLFIGGISPSSHQEWSKARRSVTL